MKHLLHLQSPALSMRDPLTIMGEKGATLLGSIKLANSAVWFNAQKSVYTCVHYCPLVHSAFSAHKNETFDSTAKVIRDIAINIILFKKKVTYLPSCI